VWSLQNYILHIDTPQLSWYKKWLLVIVCIFVLTRVEKVVVTNHIVSMKDEKDYLKPNINALIKWWILLIQLWIQCRWIEEFVTYSCGNEMYYCKELLINENKSPLLIL
jgi:hypothetical protein